MKSTCIVGAGISGLIVVLLLHEAGADLSQVSIIDPFFDGGDLSRRWTTVLSNTPWAKTFDSLVKACPSLPLASSNDPASLTPLVEIAQFIRTISTPILQKITCIQGTVASADFSKQSKEWTLQITSHVNIVARSKQLILAPGGEPKTMNLGIPSIPLEIALDPSRLKNYVKPSQKILVFGTMHSGSLVIRNCSALGAQVIGYHRSPKPFLWDRDGDYDGIKGEAADIADKILSGAISTTLIPTTDVAGVIRSSRGADWSVYAMGFSPRQIPLSLDGILVSSTEYSGTTGLLTSVPAWGFGLAYPNRAPDGIHWDVGVAPFLDHIKKQIPVICSDTK